MFRGLGFRVLGFRVLGFKALGFRVLGFRVLGVKVLRFRVLGGFGVSGFRVLGFRVLGFKVLGFGFRVGFGGPERMKLSKNYKGCIGFKDMSNQKLALNPKTYSILTSRIFLDWGPGLAG